MLLMQSTDFSKGRVWRNIVAQSIPLVLAQLVQLLYNVVDRIYIGHLPGTDSLALTGIGLAFPLTTLIAAFTFLFGTGGTPLFSIARGAREEERAEKILGNTCSLLFCASILLLLFCSIFCRPILYLFGASDDSYQYAEAYLRIYLLGTTFSMLSTGLNGFINAQGFPRTGMMTTLLGAVLNLILDPLFILTFQLGVQGAAVATILSQMVSAAWVLIFLRSKGNQLSGAGSMQCNAKILWRGSLYRHYDSDQFSQRNSFSASKRHYKCSPACTGI